MSQLIMIDLETLGTSNNAAILSIGAVPFTYGGGPDTSNTFYRSFNMPYWYGTKEVGPLLKFAELQRRSIDVSTARWWLDNNFGVFNSTFVNSPTGTEAVNLPSVLVELSAWLNTFDDIKPMGNGAMFDIGILEDAFSQHALNVPWKFWNVLDMRTVMDMGERLTGVSSKEIRKQCFKGDAHNALDDAVSQAYAVSDVYNMIAGRGQCND